MSEPVIHELRHWFVLETWCGVPVRGDAVVSVSGKYVTCAECKRKKSIHIFPFLGEGVIHFINWDFGISSESERTRCGRDIEPTRVTTVEEEVTCKTCIRSIAIFGEDGSCYIR